MDYSRQENVLEEAQKKIESLIVAIVGVGALGSVTADLLTRAGVKKLILIDRDVVEESNLHRQALYTEEAIGKPKVEVLAAALKKIRSIAIEEHFTDLHYKNVTLLNEADIIVDGTDNTHTRLLINEYCLKNKKPWIFGSAIREEGYVMFVKNPGFSHIMKPAALETCDQVGVLNSITHTVASLQVQMLYDWVRGKEKSELFHLTPFSLESISVPDVPFPTSFPYLEGEGETVVKLCGRDTYQCRTEAAYESFKDKGFTDIRFGLRKDNVLLLKDGRVLIHADSEKEAKSVFAKVVGS